MALQRAGVGRSRQTAESAGELGEEFLVVINDVLAADHRCEFNNHAELSTPGCEVGKQLFVTFCATKHHDAAFAGSMNAEQQFKTLELVFLCHGTTFPEFDELGIGRLLHVDVIELDVSQIKLHGFFVMNTTTE